MRRFVLAALFMLGSTAPALAEEVCTLKRIAVIPFETDDTGHIYVPTTIGSQKTRLMVDTGAFWSFIDADLAKSLNLRSQVMFDGYIVDAAGEKLDKYVTVPEMRMGNVIIGVPMDFVVGRASSKVEENGGVLGLNFFTRHDLEIDNAGKTISLFSQDHCKGAGVHWADAAVTLEFKRKKLVSHTETRITTAKNFVPINRPIVGAELDGEPVRVLFDTGATFSGIHLDHAKRRWGITPSSPGVEAAGKSYSASGTAIDMYSYTFKTLTVSGIKFENVPVHLGKFDDEDLVLGMNELKRLHLYFAFKDGMIHITGADDRHTQ